MTNFSKSATLVLALPLLFASYVVTAKVQVQGSSKSDINVSYSFPTQLTVRAPVVVTFRINNKSTQVVSLDLGQDRKGGFLFTVTHPDGTILKLPEYKHEGIS